MLRLFKFHDYSDLQVAITIIGLTLSLILLGMWGSHNIEKDSIKNTKCKAHYQDCHAPPTNDASVYDQPAEKHANDSKSASNEFYFVGTKVQFWLALLCGGLGGLLIGSMLLQFIFFIQRRANRRP